MKLLSVTILQQLNWLTTRFRNKLCVYSCTTMARHGTRSFQSIRPEYRGVQLWGRICAVIYRHFYWQWWSIISIIFYSNSCHLLLIGEMYMQIQQIVSCVSVATILLHYRFYLDWNIQYRRANHCQEARRQGRLRGQHFGCIISVTQQWFRLWFSYSTPLRKLSRAVFFMTMCLKGNY